MKSFLLLILLMLCMPASANNNELKPCPNTPNCVSSAIGSNNLVEPFKLQQAGSFDIEKLVSAIEQLDKRITISHQGNSIHAEISSRFFGFVDDLDLIVNEEEKLIHVRSASRLGYYDFCVNRKRVDKLREILKKAGITQ